MEWLLFFINFLLIGTLLYFVHKANPTLGLYFWGKKTREFKETEVVLLFYEFNVKKDLSNLKIKTQSDCLAKAVFSITYLQQALFVNCSNEVLFIVRL